MSYQDQLDKALTTIGKNIPIYGQIVEGVRQAVVAVLTQTAGAKAGAIANWLTDRPSKMTELVAGYATDLSRPKPSAPYSASRNSTRGKASWSVLAEAAAASGMDLRQRTKMGRAWAAHFQNGDWIAAIDKALAEMDADQGGGIVTTGATSNWLLPAVAIGAALLFLRGRR